MRRKIIKQKTAYTITLPIKWVRDHNLTGSEEIELSEQNNALILSTEKQPSQQEVEIHLEKGIPHYYRILIENQYLRGTDVVNVSFDELDALNTIQEVVSNLIGFEIVEQDKNHCRVSETAMPTTQEFSRILNRLFNVIKYAQELMLEELDKNSFNNMQIFDKLISDTRRFSLFCRRTVHKQNIVSRVDEVFLDLLLERLVIIAYETYFLYQRLHSLDNKKEKINSQVINFYKETCDFFQLFSEMYFRKKTSSFAKINDVWEELYFKKGPVLFKGANDKEAMIVYHAMTLAKLVFLVAQPNTVLADTGMRL